MSDQTNIRVYNIASNFETPTIDEYYPQHPGAGYHATYLGHAINSQSIEAVRKCLKAGANPNLGSLWYEYKDKTTSNYRHPMMLAANLGRDVAFEILKELENTGATPTQEELNKMLHEAVWPLSLKCVEWCLDHGADPNYQVYKNGPNPLLLLCYRWNIEYHDNYITTAALLLRRGSQPELTYQGAHLMFAESCDQRSRCGFNSVESRSWKSHLRKEIFPHRNKFDIDEVIEQIEIAAGITAVGYKPAIVELPITIPIKPPSIMVGDINIDIDYSHSVSTESSVGSIGPPSVIIGDIEIIIDYSYSPMGIIVN